MPEKARPLALPPTGLLRLHARAAGVAVLLVALSAVSSSPAAHAKQAKPRASKTAAAKPASGKAGAARLRAASGKPALAAAAVATAGGAAAVAATHAKAAAPVQQSQAEARLLAIIRQGEQRDLDRESTRPNSSHLVISYAVFCLKKKTMSILSTP